MNFERFYFYKINLEGELFFEDSKLTDIAFLNFFFQQIQYNTTRLYPQYRYISPCGRELNFIECKDTPIVFRRLETGHLFYGGNLKVLFDFRNLIYVQNQSNLYYKFFNKNHQILYGRIGKIPLLELANSITEKDNGYFYNQYHIPEVFSFEDLIKIQINKINIC